MIVPAFHFTYLMLCEKLTPGQELPDVLGSRACPKVAGSAGVPEQLDGLDEQAVALGRLTCMYRLWTRCRLAVPMDRASHTFKFLCLGAADQGACDGNNPTVCR